MRLSIIHTALLGSLAIAGGCTPSVSLESSTEADIRAIEELQQGWFAAFNSGDLDALMAPIADDVVWMQPNLPARIGKPAVRAFYRPLFKANRFNTNFDAEEIVVSGNLAFIRGTNVGTRTLKPGAAAAEVSIPSATGRIAVKYVWLLKKESGGTWLITHNIYNSDDPLPDER